ncbi:putative riboflavin biosynthesis protein Rib7 [Myriangium duriaei CBS 260.36]|uniref:2,5-diamino-6-ribosylamino-4(3H)-pyrimidinone 5'-phosphate reductase n=1 Tax=Myriangium duriaei CBS 260.36 TaxID=1168546 RepID=A0A9P4MKB1_9PEZI|nr:putative riboflavin biosynthesis protein Rib7 [Myriangium duriaei CBS 260.36]
MSEVLSFSESEARFLETYLPIEKKDASKLPFVTLTFATSLDSSLALAPGVRTQLSGAQSKAMTHYLRSRHDAILIGVGTAIADDPGLNCRIDGVGGYGSDGLDGQPRPIIIDPSARWTFNEQSRIFTFAKEGRGRAPYIFTTNSSPPAESVELLQKYGGKYIPLKVDPTDVEHRRLDWKALLERLWQEGHHSVMVEGGASIINSLLEPQNQALIDSVIITIAPRWLGQGGVVVSPKRRTDQSGAVIPASLLQQVRWHQLGEDVVLCGTISP